MSRTELLNLREMLAALRLPRSGDEANWISDNVTVLDRWLLKAGEPALSATRIVQGIDPEFRHEVEGEIGSRCTAGISVRVREALVLKLDDVLTRMKAA